MPPTHVSDTVRRIRAAASTWQATGSTAVLMFGVIAPNLAFGNEGALDRALADWRAAAEIKGVSAACVSGDTILAGGSGVASEVGDRPFNADSQSYAGSLTKMMLSTAVAGLADRGALRFEDTLAHWQPDFPNAEAISVAELLQMRSGTFDYFAASPDNPFIGTVMADIGHLWTPDEIITAVARLEPAAMPGGAHSYSNTDYILLGRIVEAVSGQTLEAVLEETQFAPLALGQTRLMATDAVADELADGYARGSAFLFGSDTPIWVARSDVKGLESLGWAAGGVVSTARELAVWMNAFATGDLGGPALAARLTDASSPDAGYAMGFETFPTPSGLAYGHSGSLPGYAALALHIPARDLSIALMTNDEAGETGLFDLAMVLGSGACGGLGKIPLT